MVRKEPCQPQRPLHTDHNHVHHANQINHSLGFSLVELIVSMSMAGVLMLGLSVFFASTFHNLFQAQNNNAAIERQFAVNQILEKKFSGMDHLIAPTSFLGDKDGPVLFFNKKNAGQLPFTMIGTKSVGGGGGGTHLAFKDLMVFNKIIYDGSSFFYGDRDNQDGLIKNTSDNSVVPVQDDPYFAGFDKKTEGCFYVAEPNLNIVKSYGCGGEVVIKGLNSPMDVVSDGTDLYVSDSGNNRILKFASNGNKLDFEVGDLSFPTGLAFYKKSEIEKYLFVSDTFNNKVKRIDVTDPINPKISTVAGDGEEEDCVGSTARFCKLDMPTGLFVYVPPSDTKNPELYIADSENSRVLKVIDPPTKVETPVDLDLEFGLSENFALDKIVLDREGGSWSDGTFDETNTNLAGDFRHYDPATKTFKNPDQFTVFSNIEYGCESSATSFYINQKPPYLAEGDVLKIGDTGSVSATVVNSTPATCTKAGDPPFTTYLTKITINPGLSAGPLNGTVVYLSNPIDTNGSGTKTRIRLTGVKWAKSGFQKTAIETYDLRKGLVDTDYVVTRVGDGVLGTPEDVISVLVDPDLAGLEFPTGVSNAFVADSVKNSLINYSGSNNRVLYAFQSNLTQDFNSMTVDYMTDFDIKSIEFRRPDSTRLLEMILTVPKNPDDPTSMEVITYQHTAVIDN